MSESRWNWTPESVYSNALDEYASADDGDSEYEDAYEEIYDEPLYDEL